jgi:hypothetical protein
MVFCFSSSADYKEKGWKFKIRIRTRQQNVDRKMEESFKIKGERNPRFVICEMC